jgi:hypothetical protein
MKKHDLDSTVIISMFTRAIRVLGGLAALAALVVLMASDGTRTPVDSLFQSAAADEHEYDSEQDVEEPVEDAAEEVVEIESIITEEDDNLNTAGGAQGEGAAEVDAPIDPSYESDADAEDVGMPAILTEEDDEELPVDVDRPGDVKSD